MEQNRGRGVRRRDVGAVGVGAVAGALAGGDLLGPLLAGSTSVVEAAAPLQQGSLVGVLEGPTIVTDGTVPAKFGEAPALAALVKSGSLPPVEQRLPKNPMVIKPLQSIGKYGGTWRRAFTGPGDGENGNRICSTDKPLFWDYTGTKVMPCHAAAYDLSADAKTITLTLREGMKWSDGAPFSADDYIFWFEHIFQNKELMPSQSPEMSVNGKQGTVKKVDDITVQWVFPEAYPLFVDILAGSTALGAGHDVKIGRAHV